MHTTWRKMREWIMSLRTQSEWFHSGYFKISHLNYLIIVNLTIATGFILSAGVLTHLIILTYNLIMEEIVVSSELQADAFLLLW